MVNKSKVILGLKRPEDFSEAERHKIIQEYMSSGRMKKDIWFKYTGQKEEHGNLLKWMRQLGYNGEKQIRRFNFVENNGEMAKKRDLESESFETLQLKKRIEELEKQLKDAEMKAIAFSTMIDIAEKNLNIPIRKKVNTKPLNK